MKRCLYQFIVMLLSIGGVTAQNVTPPLTPQSPVITEKSVTQNPLNNWSNQLFISDVNGRPVVNRYPDISGSPYFNTEYKFASVILENNKKFANIKMRLDLVAQEIYFIASNGVEAFIEAGKVKEIAYYDTSSDGKIIAYKFQSGLPAIDKQTERNFYQLLAEGHCSFLKSSIKKISEKKSELSGEVTKEFETYENYYLFINGEMKRLKKDKEFILAELADKQAQMSQYIQSQKLNPKNNEHLIKIINYYNTL
ncbi:MAG: hypothetical protein ABIS69_10310 [Sediminibacterium sp.]